MAGVACAGLGWAVSGCATVTVIESSGGEARLSEDQRSLRKASERAVADARAAGWGEAPGGSFTDVLRHGRRQDGPEDAVAAYFSAKGSVLSPVQKREAVAVDLAAASESALALAGLAEAVAQQSVEPGDLQQAELALIVFRRAESLFSAAVARLDDAANPAAGELLRARLATYGGSVRRLGAAVDALAQARMDAADAVS